MEISFEELTWAVKNPPGPAELVAEEKDCRLRKGRMLVIVPSYHDSRRLSVLIRSLRKQSFRDFDLAIIYAKDDKLLESAGRNVLHVRRKEDYGFAGAVYAGQLIALREGYDCYLFTDVDKIPADHDTFGRMIKNLDSGYDVAMGRVRIDGYFIPPSKVVRQKPSVGLDPWIVFSLIRTKSIWKTGLYFLPLYLGVEDHEFLYRARKAGLKIKMMDEISFCTMITKGYYKLERLLEKGKGRDSTYQYAFLYAFWNMPEIFASQIASSLLLHPRYALSRFQLFFVPYLIYRIFCLRMPRLHEYEKAARKGRLVVASWSGLKDELKLIQGTPRGFESKPGKNSGILPFFGQALLKGKPRRHSSLLLFLASQSFVADIGPGGKPVLAEWKRNISPLRLFAEFFLALALSIAMIALGFARYATERHCFMGYGMKRAREIARE